MGKDHTHESATLDGATLPRTSSTLPEGDGADGSTTLPLRRDGVSAAGSEHAGERVRYTPSSDVLGAGGMGTVRVARDDRFDREVALKSMNAGTRDDSSARVRFFREARIQGRLEHPSIVPVYDLGTSADGEPYFTMKRVRGQSLAQILRAQREGKTIKLSRRRLISALGQVAIAVHYAHERGVVHRDIKPGNIMLGPYGEVYLIDWGVAKLAGELTDERGAEPKRSSEVPPDPTQSGDVIGSLCTMAPEQARGDEVDARADVYALGAVLFEILTLQPLHPSGPFSVVAATILSGVETRPSVRCPEADVPPELEALCVAATRLHVEDRLPSALAFNEAIEAHLDGERDEQLRRESSRAHAEEARRRTEEALRAVAAEDGEKADRVNRVAEERELDLRAGALREVGRALALDATNRSALGTLVTLLTTPPRIIPQEVVLEQQSIWRQQVRLAALGLLAAHALIIAHILVLFCLSAGEGERIARCLLPSAGVIVLSGVTYARPSALHFFGGCVLAMVSCVYDANLFSSMMPFVSALLLAHAVAFSFAKTPWFRSASLVMAAGSWTAIVFGDRIGLLERTTRYVDGDLVLHSPAMSFDPQWFPSFMYAAVLAMILVPGLLIAALRRTFQRSDDLMRLHAWQLRQLVPEENRT